MMFFSIIIILKQPMTGQPHSWTEICEFQDYLVMQGLYFLNVVPLWAMTSKCLWEMRVSLKMY